MKLGKGAGKYDSKEAMIVKDSVHKRVDLNRVLHHIFVITVNTALQEQFLIDILKVFCIL